MINSEKGILDGLLDDNAQAAKVPHLSTVNQSLNHKANKTTDDKGKRLIPLSFRLTNQPLRHPRFTNLLSYVQDKSRKEVTLGLMMSAMADVGNELHLANGALTQEQEVLDAAFAILVERMRDI
ncbi:hypothetical protein [Vibrio sp. R78045]|uniref:hypothetical protein n=1 Tax=Vibrio sp. R78045 TaxID=3093868 RepID=UPI0036F43A17